MFFDNSRCVKSTEPIRALSPKPFAPHIDTLLWSYQIELHKVDLPLRSLFLFHQ